MRTAFIAAPDSAFPPISLPSMPVCEPEASHPRRVQLSEFCVRSVARVYHPRSVAFRDHGGPMSEFVVDVDSHIMEPPDLWQRYLEPKYRDRAIYIRQAPDGEELVIDGQVLMKGRLASLGGVEHDAAALFMQPDVPYLAGCPAASMKTDA